MSTATVYIRLMDEGTDVFRPTLADQIEGDCYRLRPAEDYDPDDERWEFLPGQLVRCQYIELSGGRRLVAVALA
jgi:hypothetical protein